MLNVVSLYDTVYQNVNYVFEIKQISQKNIVTTMLANRCFFACDANKHLFVSEIIVNDTM